jgi:hypothetical protein
VQFPPGTQPPAPASNCRPFHCAALRRHGQLGDAMRPGIIDAAALASASAATPQPAGLAGPRVVTALLGQSLPAALPARPPLSPVTGGSKGLLGAWITLPRAWSRCEASWELWQPGGMPCRARGCKAARESRRAALAMVGGSTSWLEPAHGGRGPSYEASGAGEWRYEEHRCAAAVQLPAGRGAAINRLVCLRGRAAAAHCTGKESSIQ